MAVRPSAVPLTVLVAVPVAVAVAVRVLVPRSVPRTVCALGASAVPVAVAMAGSIAVSGSVLIAGPVPLAVVVAIDRRWVVLRRSPLVTCGALRTGTLRGRAILRANGVSVPVIPDPVPRQERPVLQPFQADRTSMRAPRSEARGRTRDVPTPPSKLKLAHTRLLFADEAACLRDAEQRPYERPEDRGRCGMTGGKDQALERPSYSKVQATSDRIFQTHHGA